jgi:photosystem II stability/assembly factor-like uncharacterized protein
MLRRLGVYVVVYSSFGISSCAAGNALRSTEFGEIGKADAAAEDLDANDGAMTETASPTNADADAAAPEAAQPGTAAEAGTGVSTTIAPESGVSVATVPEAGVSRPTGTPPSLTPGVWANITPQGVDLSNPSRTYGATVVEVDPRNTATVYLSVDQMGMWKSTDAGASWARLGSPPAQPNYGTTVTYLDSPIEVRVDPGNSGHLYATQGVRGNTLGFWVSMDAGNSWAQPPGFIAVKASATNDVTLLAVDPTDFNHVLVGSHSPWVQGPTGVLETRDGGNTFIMHPGAGNWAGTIGINFLFDPAHGVGNGQTWLVGSDGDGLWRTTNSGSTWSQVSTYSAVHGGNRSLYFSKAGAIYAGGNNQMLRSTDQGSTWTLVGPRFQDGYYQVIGDGNVLYAQEANTGGNSVGPQPYITSPETDGVNWTNYQGGAQKFSDGPYTMRFDPVNRILYSANWRAGLWALKVLGP